MLPKSPSRPINAFTEAKSCACRGRLCLYGRKGVRDTDLNFPVEAYGADEVPGSIEELQAYIKESQVRLLRCLHHMQMQ